MKRQIRHSVWETNSSSQHSIVVMKDGLNLKNVTDDVYVYNKDKCYHIWKSEIEFGRSPFRILTSVKDKFLYCLASECGEYYTYMDKEKGDVLQKKAAELINVFKEQYPEIEDIEIPTTENRVYLDENGNEVKAEYDGYDRENKESIYVYKDANGEKHRAKEADYVYDINYYGQIDHQSMGILSNFLSENNVTLRDFILNPKYKVIIDGDEYCEWQNFVKSGLINVNNIEKQYPNYMED